MYDIDMGAETEGGPQERIVDLGVQRIGDWGTSLGAGRLGLRRAYREYVTSYSRRRGRRDDTLNAVVRGCSRSECLSRCTQYMKERDRRGMWEGVGSVDDSFVDSVEAGRPM